FLQGKGFNGTQGRTSGYLLYRCEIRHMRLDCTEQLFFAERFGQVLVGPHDAALGLVEQTILGRQHDYRRRLEGTVVLDQRTGLITIQPRHHDIDEDDAGVSVRYLGERIETVDCRDDVTTHFLQ